MASPSVAPRSDSGCELGEGIREPMPRIDVGGKFVVAAAEVSLRICRRHSLRRRERADPAGAVPGSAGLGTPDEHPGKIYARARLRQGRDRDRLREGVGVDQIQPDPPGFVDLDPAGAGAEGVR
jgi:hypothetical protein